MLLGLDHVQNCAIRRDGKAVRIVQIDCDLRDRSVSGDIENLAVDHRSQVTGRREINTAVSIGCKVVRPHEFVAVLIVRVSREHGAVGRHASNAAIVVTRCHEFAMARWSDGGLPAAIFSRKYRVLWISDTNESTTGARRR